MHKDDMNYFGFVFRRKMSFGESMKKSGKNRFRLNNRNINKRSKIRGNCLKRGLKGVLDAGKLFINLILNYNKVFFILNFLF